LLVHMLGPFLVRALGAEHRKGELSGCRTNGMTGKEAEGLAVGTAFSESRVVKLRMLAVGRFRVGWCIASRRLDGCLRDIEI